MSNAQLVALIVACVLVFAYALWVGGQEPRR